MRGTTAIGARVVTATSAANREYLRDLGADEIIDYNAQDFSKVVTGCDAVFDRVGRDVAQKSFAVLKPGGRAAFIASGAQAPKPNRNAIAQTCGWKVAAVSRAHRRTARGTSHTASRGQALSPIRSRRCPSIE
jgi:NADPH:quinone reductase-like Zn-dependent oxidoreductase